MKTKLWLLTGRIGSVVWVLTADNELVLVHEDQIGTLSLRKPRDEAALSSLSREKQRAYRKRQKEKQNDRRAA